jgi:Holliday junction resolvase RusA-like endonuclease
MKLTFRYEGNTPSKKNQKRIIRTKQGRPLIMPSEAYKAWHGPAVLAMTLQRSAYTGVPFPIDRCSRIYARLFYTDRRRRDSSNTFESIMDLLVDAGILADDAWAITGPTAQFPELRPDRPGFEIILELPSAAPGLAEAHRYQEPAKA